MTTIPANSEVTRTWLWRYFLKLGIAGFGGPIALVGMMEQDLVQTRKLISKEAFDESYALCKMSPGPVASQMVLHLSRRVFDRKTAIIAMILHIVPAALIVVGLSAILNRFQGHHSIRHLIESLQAPTLAVIIASVIQFVRPHLRSLNAILIIIACAIATYFRPTLEPIFIVALGIVFAVIHTQTVRKQKATKLYESGSALMVAATIFGICFKATSLLFGTGLAIVPMLEADFVHRLHWVSQSDFLTGLMIGQITPGPIIITTTYLGYRILGNWGAVAATLGAFLPGVFLSLFIMPKIWRVISKRDLAKPFLSGATLAISGGLVSSSIRLSLINLNSLREVLFAAVLLAAALSKRIPFPVIILGSGILIALVT